MPIMRHTVILGIVFTFTLLFTTSSGVLKGQVFASIEEERDNYYPDEYSQYDKDSSLYIGSPGLLENLNVDREQLKEIEDKLFEGIDKERLLINALNLLKNLDFEELNEESLPDPGGYLPYGGFWIVIAIIVILAICFFVVC